MSDYARAVSSSIEPASPQLLEHVPAWLTVPEIAERLGVTLARVRQMIEDREVLAARVGDNRAIAAPEAFFDDDGPLPALKGTFTVLSDGGMDDQEILEWLFTPDASLPAPGAPIDNLRAGFKTEIRRRAMELAL
ncbi:MAG: excisionase family DNA-binding protein [Actinomycetales bacterium]|nr:excisionase family DNA-binding protein [Actinomycetales bacterium]